MAKDKESLEKSRKERAEILLKFGGNIPESIMKHIKSDSAIDFVASGKKADRSRKSEYTRHIQKLLETGMDIKTARTFGNTPSGNKQKSKISEQEYFKGKKLNFYKEGMEKEESNAFCVSGVERNSGTLSLFSQSVGRNLINLYTKENDIIIDPFAGHNSRMQLCFESKRNYYGCDICHEFMEMNKELKVILKKKSFIENNQIIELCECDSKKMPFKNDFGNFTITSPPYWNMEYYGDEEGQLGFSETYDKFLDSLQQIMKENFRVLKKDSFCVWFVNDFRKDGKFYNYHGDVINRMEQIGFIQHDIIIVDLGTSFQTIFATQIVRNKIVAKRHEYALVFKKG